MQASFLSPPWRPVASDQAHRAPNYGVGGWLWAFAAFIALSAGHASVRISDLARDSAMTYGEVLGMLSLDLVKFVDALLVFAVVRAVVVLTLLFTRHRLFRPVATASLVVAWPVEIVAYLCWPVAELRSMVVLDGFTWALGTALWTLYLQRSERVRVTFEHLVPVRDDKQKAESAFAVPVESSGRRLEAPSKVAGGEESTAMDQTACVAAEGVSLELPRTLQAATEPPSPHPEPRCVSMAPLQAPADPPLPSIPPEVLSPSPVQPAEQFWAQAFEELESGQRRTGLWARAFATHAGDLPATQAAYLRERAVQLQQEAQEVAAQAASALQAQQAADAAEALAQRTRIERLRQAFLDGKVLTAEQTSSLARGVTLFPDIATIHDSKWSDTVLHRCVRLNLMEEAELLEAAGAVVDAENAFGHWPYMVISKAELRMRGLPA